MTTSQSPLSVLKAQADKIAATLKAAQRGENVEDRFTAVGNVPKGIYFKFAVVMDDKTLIIEIPWSTIKNTSEVGLAEYILRQMRGARETMQ